MSRDKPVTGGGKAATKEDRRSHMEDRKRGPVEPLNLELRSRNEEREAQRFALKCFEML